MPKRLLIVLACGYILMFYSEHVFWAHVRTADTLFGYMTTWVLYSFLALCFLSLIAHFKVHNIWALFLCGALFGWLTEGVIVQTTYENLPLSISFTALAWHAPLSIWVGWYAVRKSIQSGIGSTLKLATAIGIFYGLWAISWWSEPGDIIASPLEFMAYTGITTLLLIIAYWTYDQNISALKIGRTTKLVLAGLLLLYFAVITVPTVPISIIVLPILLLMVYMVLRKNLRVEISTSMLTNTNALPPLRNYLVILVMPLTATLIYSVTYIQRLEWHTNWLVYLVTMPLGFVLLGISLVKVWRSTGNYKLTGAA